MVSKDSFLYGTRPIIEAIKAGKEIDKIFVQKGLQGEVYQELMDMIREYNVPFQYVPIEKLNKLTMKNHQGVACFVSIISYTPIENLIPMVYEKGETPLVLILDRITDVRNFGAIARTAECAGVDAIIIPARGGAQINSDALKTSAGALHNIPICRSENIKQTIDFLKKSGLQIIAATEKSGDYHFKIDYNPPTAIIMGSEEDGISPEYLRMADYKVSIPILGEIESLNVSVACGVLIYEAVKQRFMAV